MRFIAVLLPLLACASPGAGSGVDGEDGQASDGPGAIEAPEPTMPGFPPGEPEAGCCDNLVELGAVSAAEAVDVVFDGRYVVACGGFGAQITDIEGIGDAVDPEWIGSASARCQNAAFGEALPDGRRVLYTAHHGDSWVEAPTLTAFAIDPEASTTNGDAVVEMDRLEDAGQLFEGLEWRDGVLFVALHSQGLAAYATDPLAAVDPNVAEAFTLLGGVPSANAIEVALNNAGTHAYVADGAAGVQIVDVSDPSAMVVLDVLEPGGLARDVAVAGDRLYVALGGDGVEVYDLADGQGGPVSLGRIASLGSAQAVAANDDRVAVAAWSRVEIYAPDSFDLLATESTNPYPGNEQNLGVALDGDRVIVAEWNLVHVLEHRPEEVGGDLLVADRRLSFAPDAADSKVLVVENLGAGPLRVNQLATDTPGYWVDDSPFELAPGEKRAVEVGFRPPGLSQMAQLRLLTDDPDPAHAGFILPLDAVETDRLGVGDSIDERFAFLHPDGLPGLEGKVVILAYFALF